jgi:NTE family protein
MAEVLEADLVLEGGGVKGIGLVGALAVLEERGYRFHRVAGTSAGAIVGALVAAGVSAAELHTVMKRLDYRKFRDKGLLDELGPFGQAASLLLESGVYEGGYLKEWLADLLAGHGVHTFADLRDDDRGSAMPRPKRHRLVVMTSDISQGRLRRLPWDYPAYDVDPDSVPVVDAVRASMSIPFFYEPVKLVDRKTKDTCWLVDGGMLSDFPIEVFDRPTGEKPRWPTFGIKLSGRPDPKHPVVNKVHGVLSMTRAMVMTMMSFHDRLHLDDPSVLARTMFVDTTGVSPIDFDISKRTQQRLYDNGRVAAEKFLDGAPGHPKWDFGSYVSQFRSGRQETARPTS